MKPKTIIFLNDNPLPKIFTQGTISAKELRLRAAISSIQRIYVITPAGTGVSTGSNRVGPLEKKIIIHHLPSCPYYFRSVPLFIWGLYYGLKYKPDVIEAESPIISGPAAIFIGRLLHIPTLIEVRASYHHLIKSKLNYLPYWLKKIFLDLVYFFTLNHANTIIANSKTYKKELARWGIPSTTVNPGLQYPPTNLTSSKTTKLTHPKTIKFGYLGRLAPEKGAHLLIQAFALTLQKANQPLQLFIAGDGPELTHLKNLSQKSPAGKHIHFLGLQPNYKTLAKWHILVNPCIAQAPLEMVNAEAALMGVPVITYGTKTIPETVVHLQTGLIVTAHHPQALAAAMIKLVHNHALRNKLGQAGPSFAKKYYDFGKQVKSLEKVYISLTR